MVHEDIKLTFNEVCVLYFPEATIEECIIHARNSKRDPEYYLHFLNDFIREYSDSDYFVDYYPKYIYSTLSFLPDFIINIILKAHIFISKKYYKLIDKQINMEKADLDVLYTEILNKRFAWYFASSKKWNTTETIPVDDILDIISKRIWNPFNAIKTITYSQFKSILDGYLLNKNKQHEKWDKANKKLIQKDIREKNIERNKNNPDYQDKQKESFNILDKLAKKFTERPSPSTKK